MVDALDIPGEMKDQPKRLESRSCPCIAAVKLGMRKGSLNRVPPTYGNRARS